MKVVKRIFNIDHLSVHIVNIHDKKSFVTLFYVGSINGDILFLVKRRSNVTGQE